MAWGAAEGRRGIGVGKGVGTRGRCPQNGPRDAVWEKAVRKDWGRVGGVVLLLGLSGSLGEQRAGEA